MDAIYAENENVFDAVVHNINQMKVTYAPETNHISFGCFRLFVFLRHAFQ